MIKTLTFILFLLISSTTYSQQTPLKEYSHTAFFQLLKNEKEATFTLKNAFVRFDSKTDSAFFYTKKNNDYNFTATDTLFIDKEVVLENVHFEHLKDTSGAALHHLVFNKEVTLYNTTSISFVNCVFNAPLDVDCDLPLNTLINNLGRKYENYEAEIGFSKTNFNSTFFMDIGTIEQYSSIDVYIENSNFNIPLTTDYPEFAVNNIRFVTFQNNAFHGNGFFNFFIDTAVNTKLAGNHFGNYRVTLSKSSMNNSFAVLIEKNAFVKHVLLEIESFNSNHTLRWKQWQHKIISNKGFQNYINTIASNDDEYEEFYNNDSIFTAYKNRFRYQIENSYKYEAKLLGNFYDFYKSQHDFDYANKAYVQFKNLETQRYKYLYKENPSFNSYFTWKINQFLNVFSAYGTNPSLSIVFSLYVILIFAIIYMLFPNNWETGRKNKLMNRLQFFTKYFRRKEGIKEIYEEEKQETVMSFNEFRKYMHSSKKEIPSYFIWLTKPIYYFSSYNYKLTGRVLKYTDILKGRWVDLPKRRKFLTSVIMALWIVSLIVLDILIKFFNALTLSINTFTTLGFGEIPIKGIPRYLAVIQGFIGWFMLTIFSVSLISQLLN